MPEILTVWTLAPGSDPEPAMVIDGDQIHSLRIAAIHDTVTREFGPELADFRNRIRRAHLRSWT